MNHLESYKQSLKNRDFKTNSLLSRFLETRNQTEKICSGLELEDYVVQPSPEVSPPKWHLAHTSWLIEEVVLSKYIRGYEYFDDSFRLLFNSYYKGAGKHWVQDERGQLSRPTVKSVFDYRKYINSQVEVVLNGNKIDEELYFIIELVIQHEQQHQELLLMDIKMILATNPSFPKFSKDKIPATSRSETSWTPFSESIYEIGHNSMEFAFDNEGPRHKTYLYPFAVRDNTVSNEEYLHFIEDGGYRNPRYWLSAGWDWLQENHVECPLYWMQENSDWFEYSLYGLNKLDMNSPVTHINFFEADAFANWTGNRLPTEAELEVFLESSKDLRDQSKTLFHPISCKMPFNEVWCWTRSQYLPYPGFRTFDGLLGEYNGKFMCNQFVLKGGSIGTQQGHYRNSYRNFFEPHQRWMFSGIRLAMDLEWNH